MKNSKNVLKKVAASCPYTIAGSKVIKIAQGKRPFEKIPETDRERGLIARVKLGRNIALIGVFCPFFWITLLSGIRGRELYLNAVHSGIVILLGLVVMTKNKIDLARENSPTELNV